MCSIAVVLRERPGREQHQPLFQAVLIPFLAVPTIIRSAN